MLTPQEYLDCAKEENRQKIQNQLCLITDHVEKEFSMYLERMKNSINKNIYTQIEITKFNTFEFKYDKFKADIIQSILDRLYDWSSYLKIEFETFGNFYDNVALILRADHDFQNNKFMVVR